MANVEKKRMNLFETEEKAMNVVDRLRELRDNPAAIPETLPTVGQQELTDFIGTPKQGTPSESPATGPIDILQPAEQSFDTTAQAQQEHEQQRQQRIAEEQGKLQKQLGDYITETEGRGGKPFEHANTVKRLKEARENPQRFGELSELVQSGDDFIERSEKYGVDTERLQRFAKISPTITDEAKASVVLRDIYGKTGPAEKEALARELGLPKWETQEVLGALPGYLNQKQDQADAFTRLNSEAFLAATKPSYEERVEWLEGLDDTTKKELTPFYQSKIQEFEQHFGDVLPLARTFADNAKKSLTSNEGGGRDYGDLRQMAPEYAKLNEENREKFWSALYLISEAEGEDVDGWFKNLGVSAARGGETLVIDAGTKVVEFFGNTLEDQEGTVFGDLLGVERAGLRETGSSGIMTARKADVILADENASEEDKQEAQNYFAYRKLLKDIGSSRQLFSRLEDEGLLGLLNSTSTSLSYLAVAATGPVGLTVTGLHYTKDAEDQLLDESPDLDPEKRQALAVTTGIVKSMMEKIGIKALGAGKGFRFLPEHTAKTILGQASKRALIGGSTELFTEVQQELTLDYVKAAARAFDKEIPKAQFGKTIEAIIETAPELVFSSFLFGAVGAGVTTGLDTQTSKAINELIEAGQLPVTGIDDGAQERVKSGETPTQRLEIFKKELEKTSPEERAENIRKADLEAVKREAVSSIQGRSDDLEFQNNRAITDDFVAHIAEFKENAGEEFAVQFGGAKKLLDHVTKTNREAVIVAGRASARSQGIDVNTLTDEQILDLESDGSVSLLPQLSGISVELAQSGNVLTAVEEVGEGTLRLAEARQEVDPEALVTDLRAVDATLIPEDYQQLSEQEQYFARVEGFSNFLKGYAVEQSLQAENPEAPAKELSLPESIGSALRKLFHSATRHFRSVVDTAKAILAAKSEGTLSRDLEALADHALGVDRQFIHDREQARAQREILAETQGDRVSSLVKGKLPRPDDPIIAGDSSAGINPDPLRGELEAIKDAFQAKAKGRGKNSKAAAFFAKKGEGVELDRLRQNLNEDGFDFETPAEMLEAVFNDVNEGAVSFSITPSQDADYLAAVEAGDTETAQRMVDEAAKKAGYDSPKLYHGTPESHLEKSKIFQTKEEGLARFIGKELAEKSRAYYATTSKAVAGTYAQWDRNFDQSLPPKVYSLFFKAKNFKSIDGKGERWRKTESAVEEAKKEGFDGITIKNSRDEYADLGKGEISDVYVSFLSNQIKSADPVTYDESGNVIPLSERFNEADDRISFAVRLPGESARLEAELDKLFTGVADKITIGRKILKRLRLAQDDFDKSRTGKKATQQQLVDKALNQLDAVIGALPIEIRGKAAVIDGVAQRGSAFQEVAALKTQKERVGYITKRLYKVEQVLEDYLVKEYRRKIKAQLKQAKIGKTPSGGQRPKLTPFGQRIMDRVREIIVLDDAQLEARAVELEGRIEKDKYTNEDERTIDHSVETYLVRTFGNYDQADSNRLDESLRFIKEQYYEQRSALLEKLKGKKEHREAAIVAISESLDQVDEVFPDQLNRNDLPFIQKLELAIRRNLLSGAGLFDILASRTGNYKPIDEIQKSIRDAANNKHDRQQKVQKWIDTNLKEIYGNQSAIDKALFEGNKEIENNGVTFAHLRSNQEFTVAKKELERVIESDAPTISAKRKEKEEWVEETITLDVDSREVIQRAWDKYKELPEESQSRKRVLSFWHNTAKEAGKAEPRREHEKLSHMKALHLKLMIERPAIRRKLFASGFDEVTLVELNEFIPQELQEFGRRMVSFLEEQGVEIAAKVEDVKNLPFGNELKYFPANFSPLHKGSQESISPDEPKANRKGAEGPFLKPLQAHNAPPEIQNALDVFRAHMEESNHFLSHADFSDQWAKTFRHRDFRSRVNKRLGAETEQAILKQAELIESGFSPQGELKNGMVTWIDGFRKRATKTVLGARISTIFVQASATAKLTQALPAHKMIHAFAKAAKNPSSLRDAWNSPAITRRVEQGSIIIQSGENQGIIVDHPTMARLRRASDKPFAALRYGEAYANTVTAAAVWQHHHDAAIKANPEIDPAEAKLFADEELDKALALFAQPTQKQNLTVFGQYLEGNPLAKWVLPFTSEPLNNIQNAVAVGLWGAVTGKGRYHRAHHAQIFVTSWFILGAVESVLRASLEELAKEEDEDDGFSKFSDPGFWALQLTAGPIRFAGLPNVIYQALADQFDQDSYASGNLVESVIGGVRKGGKLLDGKKRAKMTDEEIIDAALDTIQGIGSIWGPLVIAAQGASAAEQGLDFFQHTNGERFLSDQDRFDDALEDYRNLKDFLPSRAGLKGDELKKVDEIRLNYRVKLIRDLIPPEKMKDFLKHAEKLPIGVKEKLSS